MNFYIVVELLINTYKLGYLFLIEYIFLNQIWYFKELEIAGYS